jgi:hypothetical protein
MSMTRDIALKLIAAFCAASVALALVVAHRSPAVGYELSIYNSTPASVWYLLLLSLLGGIGIVIHELATGRYQESRTYLVGFAVTLLTVVTFLCLPFVRDYITWRADQMAHIGFVEDISLTGHTGGLNAYPITHVLFFEIASVTGIPGIEVLNLNTALILPIFVLTIYLLATVVLPQRGQRLLAALIAGGAIVGIERYYLVPNTWSILMLPLLFYCYFKADRTPFKVLLLLLLVAYPFFHPLSSLVIIAALAVMELPKPIYSRLLRRLRMHVPSWVDSKPLLWPLLLELAIFLPWVLTREWLRTNVLQLWHQLTTGRGGQEIAKTGEALGKVGAQGLDVVILGMKMYGEFLILVLLAAVGIVLLLRQFRSGDRDSGKYRLFFLGLLLLLACLFYAAYFLGIPGAEALAADRILVYIEVVSITLMAFALWELSRWMNFRLLAWSGIFGVVVLASMLNIAGHYSSPYIVRPGEQVTQMDMTGMTWYLEKKDPTVYAFYIATPPERFAQAILGTHAADRRKDIEYDTQFMDHFGSDYYSTLGEQYVENQYASIHTYDKAVYQTVWWRLDRFNDVDFARLEQDPTVNRIYSNGGMDCLFITGSG